MKRMLLLGVIILTCAWAAAAHAQFGGGTGGAPVEYPYWGGASSSRLSQEKDLSALGTGLVINTAGTPSIFAGSNCTNQFPRSFSAVLGLTCQTVTSVYVDSSIAVTGASNTWAAGVKQTFSPNATAAGFNPGSFAGDPSPLANGDLWYNSSAGKFKCRQAGATVDCIGAGGGGSGYTTVGDEGTGLTQRATLNFTGAGITCVDNSGATRTDCTVTSGSGVVIGDAASGSTHNKILYTDNAGDVQELTLGEGQVPTSISGSIVPGTIDAADRALSNLTSVTTAIPFADGAKQTFNPNGTTAGFNPGSHAGNPSSLADGDLWYNSSAGALNARIGGSTVALGAGGGGGTNNIMLAFSSGAGSTYALGGSAPAAGEVFSIGEGHVYVTTTASPLTVCIPVPATATVKSVYYHIRVNGATGTTGQTIAHKLLNVTATTSTTGTSFDWDSATNTGNETDLSLAVTAGDCLAIEVTMPGTWTTPATNVAVKAGVLLSVP